MDDLARSMPKDIRDIQPFEGQMFLSMFIDANPEHAVWEFTAEDYEDIKHQVDLIAREFGIVRNVVHVDTVHDEMRLIFRIEFDSIDAAQRAIQSLRRTPVYGFGADVSTSLPTLLFLLTFSQRSYFWSTINVGDWVDERPLGSHRFQHRGDTRRPYRGQFRNEDPQDEHNRVRRERILDGSDVRTTVMLRNIPANCDWVSLSFHVCSEALLTLLTDDTQEHPGSDLLRNVRLRVPPHRFHCSVGHYNRSCQRFYCYRQKVLSCPRHETIARDDHSRQ